MQFSTRLLLCRLGLVLFCIVPTVMVMLWIGMRVWSGSGTASKVEWERELTNRLGLAVEIGEVSYPHPNVARLADVSLLEPESRAMVARAASMDVTAVANGHSVDVSQLVVEVKQLGLLTQLLEHRILRGPIAPKPAVEQLIQLLPCDIALQHADRYESLRQFGGQLVGSAGGMKLDLDFQVADAPAGSGPMRVSILRDRASTPPATRWQLDTGGAMLPCQMLVEVWSPLARLGEGCRFGGVIGVVHAESQTSCEWHGTLQQVDLDALVSEQFPHQLSGLATVEIERGVMDRGTLVELRGSLRAQNGSVSPSLVAAARKHLGLSGFDDLDERPPATVIPFRQLAIGFQLDGQSLRLTGSADPIQPGALIANAAGPILAAPPQHAANAVNLLRTLVPDSEVHVPATRQTSALVGLLPVPDVVPGPAASSAAHTPTRLSPAVSPQAAVRQPVLR